MPNRSRWILTAFFVRPIFSATCHTLAGKGGRAMKTAGHWKRLLYMVAKVVGAVVILLMILDPTWPLLPVCVLILLWLWR
jgi:hypothetical protein